MAKLSPSKLALVHLGAKRLGLDDTAYRDLLRSWCGVDSASAIDESGFEMLMEVYHHMGFVSDAAQRNYGHRPGMASFKQVNFLRGLWADYTGGQGDDASLGKWLQRTFGVPALRFVDEDLAPKAITALKAMVAKKKGNAAGGGGQAE